MKNILLNAQINDCILVENDEIKRTAEGQKDDTAEAGYGTEHESEHHKPLRERRAAGGLPDAHSFCGLLQCVAGLSSRTHR